MMEAAPSLEDVTCPICLSLFLEPVTLPCHHSLCLPCFQEHVSLTSLACPLCRTRISVWVRKNSKTNTLVDVKLWKAIQKHFPTQLEARLAGREDNLGITEKVQQKVCQPGEIRQEYESFVEQVTQEATQRKNKEEIASIKLIQQLQEEERKRQQEHEQQHQNVAQEDFLLALQLEETDKIRISTRQRELQDLCAQDEDFARQLEVAESRSPRVSSRSSAASGFRGMSASPKGPMDLYLGQKGVSQGHQPTASVLSSSDQNTRLSQDPSASPEPREPAIKLYLNHSSESESDEPPSSHHLPSASGKENLKGRRRGSPARPGEGARGRRPGHSTAHRELQLSPDIDSYCVAAKPARQQGGCGISGAPREKNCNNIEVEEVATKEEMNGDSDCSNEDLPTDVSFLLKWEKDKESLATLLSEQQLAEAQLQQELQDRLLAEALQEEFNIQAKTVSRTKGSKDEYSLRHRTKPASPHQHEPGPSRRNSTKRQATLSEFLCKRHKSE